MSHTLLPLVAAFGILVASPLMQAAFAEPADDSSRRLDSPAGGWTLSVAPDGDDANPGTEEQPLRTLPGAIAAVRKRKQAEGLPAGGVVVLFRGGKYLGTGPSGVYATLTAADSGEPGKPIVYASRPGEQARFIGGRELDSSWFRPVTEADAVWSRLDEAARGKVMRCDLAGHGIDYYGELDGNTWSRRGTIKPWLHGGGRRLPLARWPDGEHEYAFGVEKTSVTKKRNEFEYEGDRPARWLGAPDGWIVGNLGKGYIHSHERITAIDPERRRITLVEEPENHQQDLCHLDRVGVRLQGGDEKQLVGSGNRIENNLLHHVGMWSRASSVAVNVLGCGTEVVHNEIHDCPALASLLIGPRHLFQYNDVARCLLEGEEQGVVQTGGWTYGMRIEHNALRDDSPAFDVPGFQRIPWELVGRLHATQVARPVPPAGCAAVRAGRAEPRHAVPLGGRYGG